MTTPHFFRHWRDYLGLCKLKVVALIVFTAIIGMLLAVSNGLPPLALSVFASIGIALAAAAAAAINHVADQHADAMMHRTDQRPLPTGQLTNRQALVFATLLAVIAMLILVFLVNTLTAILTFLSLIGYAGVYTLYLKRATPQNIVIGGAAGAMPPVLGWVAITDHVHPWSLLLFLIIFIWTPPHFWALAIARREEYALVNIPMLPVTHGVSFTSLHVLLYTLLLLAVSLLPFVVGMSGIIYLVSAIILGGVFLYYSILLKRNQTDDKLAMKTFGYSILYLILLFSALLIDHYV